MTILATAEFFVQPDKVAGFLELLKAALPDTRSFEGCEMLETFVNQDEPGHVLLVEKWTDRAAHEKYIAWRIEGGLEELLAPFVTAPLKVSYFDPHPDV